VGMVRHEPDRETDLVCSPHARGDGPHRGYFCRFRRRFSPRTWGWSAGSPKNPRIMSVLPTHVGMVRVVGACRWKRDCSPHARGDGPGVVVGAIYNGSFSPRTWGWSEADLSGYGAKKVLPTHVGMVRKWWMLGVNGSGSPHARGDGPI